jgi:hypothetical protein
MQWGSKAYFALGLASIKNYAAMHDYEIHVTDCRSVSDRAKHWGKVTAVIEALETCDQVLYLDADCMVVNPELQFESLLTGHHDVILSRDSRWNINTGAMIITSHARDILEDWWNVPNVDADTAFTWPVDELAFNRHVYPKYRDRINAPLDRGSVYDFIRGSFIHHFPNGDEQTKLQSMLRANPRIGTTKEKS